MGLTFGKYKNVLYWFLSHGLGKHRATTDENKIFLGRVYWVKGDFACNQMIFHIHFLFPCIILLWIQVENKTFLLYVYGL